MKNIYQDILFKVSDIETTIKTCTVHVTSDTTTTICGQNTGVWPIKGNWLFRK